MASPDAPPPARPRFVEPDDRPDHDRLRADLQRELSAGFLAPAHATLLADWLVKELAAELEADPNWFDLLPAMVRTIRPSVCESGLDPLGSLALAAWLFATRILERRALAAEESESDEVMATECEGNEIPHDPFGFSSDFPETEIVPDSDVVPEDEVVPALTAPGSFEASLGRLARQFGRLGVVVEDPATLLGVAGRIPATHWGVALLFLRRLIRRGVVPAARFADLPVTPPYLADPPPVGSPRFWLEALGPRRGLAMLASSAADPMHADFAWTAWVERHRDHPALAAATSLAVIRGHRGTLLRRLADGVRQAPADPLRADETLLKLTSQWLEAGPDPTRPDLPDDVAELAVQRAREILGRLRVALRDDPDKGFSALHDHREVLAAAAWTLALRDGLWAAFKPVLLLQRNLRVPAVGPDLRTWNESGKPDTPMPWCRVPEILTRLVHMLAGREQQGDPDLLTLRNEFAEFCLERLRTRQAGKNGADGPPGPVEPSAAWREGYVRAYDELRVNPRGKGHRTLHVAMEGDPDQQVRDAAARVYKATRHGATLAPGTSPRRAVLRALWWLRQAHLIDLGVVPDRDGAQRTRDAEARHTTEAR
jgi:hypothetical protein